MMHDIFSKQKPKKKIFKPKEKIIIDYREKQSLVPSNLVKLDLDIEFKELKVADYLVKGIAIERKTISDFLCSMTNKRLLKQLEELQQYNKKLLIIEGIDTQELYPKECGINPNSVRGFLLSILLKHKIPIIFTQNSQDTARFINVIVQKQEREISIKSKKKAHSKKEQMQFILEGFPGIGPKTARKLLKTFSSIKNIANASETDLEKILGKKANIIKNLFNENY